jgi:hypothetical protein
VQFPVKSRRVVADSLGSTLPPPTMLRFPFACLTPIAFATVLAACGSGGDEAVSNNDNPPPVATGLSGTVAVGAPVAQGKLRVLDAAGNVVAQDIAVGADGSYTVPELSGTGPYRIEACGYAGGIYQCIYSVAQGAGTANVTPLTHAAVLLASGQAPGEVMSGAASGLGASSVGAAQEQLRTGLAGVLAGNVPAGFDFVSGDLSGGSRTGYDKVLDSVGVSTGVDGTPFVQITPRTGSGNLYLQGGTTSGSVTVDSAAAALSLAGLDTLFANMTRAVANANACADANAGMASQMASNARLSFDPGTLGGAAEVGAGLCQFFAESQMWGSTFMSPTLGRCDATGAEARCRVSFVLQSVDGGVQPVGHGMGVVRQNGVWKFLGSYDALHLEALARAQRSRRVDGATPVDSYERAIAIEVQNVAGLACAKASQLDSAGERVTVAYFKPWDGGAPRLSTWRDNLNGERSLDPAAGGLRGPDDTWLMLPEGAAGDEVVRNFFRGGRTLRVNLFADSACSSPFVLDGRSEFEIDVDGVPPVWAAMPSLPWPELTSETAARLSSFTLESGASGSFAASWSFPRGRAGVNGAMFCALDAGCGDGEGGRLGEREFSPAVTSTTITLPGGSNALGNTRMLSLYGAGGDGMSLQSNFMSCTNTPAGQNCR